MEIKDDQIFYLYNKSFGEEMIPIDFRKKYEFMTNIA
jgi:hypothetical protein